MIIEKKCIVTSSYVNIQAVRLPSDASLKTRTTLDRSLLKACLFLLALIKTGRSLYASANMGCECQKEGNGKCPHGFALSDKTINVFTSENTSSFEGGKRCAGQDK